MFTFRNKNHGIIVAIRLTCIAYDSFGDRIQFNGIEFLDVKKADLHVEQFTETSFSVDVDKYDVKKVEVSVKQLVYADGEMVVPKESKVVEYEVEVLTPEGSSENQFEKNALSLLKEKNGRAICFPKLHPEGWICVCGILNAEAENNCTGCGHSRQRVFE